MVPDEIDLFASPWVSGTRVSQYFGPVAVEGFAADGQDNRNALWLKLFVEVLGTIRVRASELGANAVVAVELTADPFFVKGGLTGLRVHVCGTAARLEPLF